MSETPFISVSIKTLNEAKGIEKTIDSVQRQIASWPHEIIVADSLSTDDTQALAAGCGATVVSLVRAEDRCCGVGHQMSYLRSKGDYLLLMDGDMALEPGFLEAAVNFLQRNPSYAGVAGTVELDEGVNYEFKARRQRLNKSYPLGDCDHLGGGGLYRRSAIDDVGYLTHRGLHGCEEAELGVRLLQAGYRLRRLNVPFFSHRSHRLSTLALLRRRWRSRYLDGPGELLRSSLGKPWFGRALRIVRNEAIFTIYLVVVLSTLFSGCLMLFGIALLPLVAFTGLKTVKNRSLRDGFYSVLNLTALAAGTLRGLVRPVADPGRPPESKVIHQQADSNESSAR